MTEEEVNEKYSKELVGFHRYWKYVFTFRGWVDGVLIEVCYGGDSGDIYRYGVDTDLIPFGDVNNWSSVLIRKNSTLEVLYEKHNY